MHPNDSTNAPTPTSVMTTAEVVKALRMGRTRFWQALKDGALPQPNFHIGPRQPRWIWGSVLEHLEGRTKEARESAEV
jgi:predicted DNA-binding transcriptional regulator AlpA